jgi:hypothetical protein
MAPIIMPAELFQTAAASPIYARARIAAAISVRWNAIAISMPPPVGRIIAVKAKTIKRAAIMAATRMVDI